MHYVLSRSQALLWLITSVLSTLSTVCHAGQMGPGGTGGGNWQEADFVIRAEHLSELLSAHPALTLKYLGIRAEDFQALVDSTQVQCSFGDFTKKLRGLNKQAYYDRISDGIYLDCDRYDKASNPAGAKTVTNFHEYMRKLVSEGSEYRVSSKLLRALVAIRGELSAPECALELNSVENLLGEFLPTLKGLGQVLNSIKEKSNEKAPLATRVAPSTGAIFTRDTSVPGLQEAYRDPSGLIWGEAYTERGDIRSYTWQEANLVCPANTRLPNKEEFEKLAVYLGKNSVRGYNPITEDGKTPVFEWLNGNGLTFWSSSPVPGRSNNVYSFCSGRCYDGAAISYVNTTMGSPRPVNAVRCVARVPQ